MALAAFAVACSSSGTGTSDTTTPAVEHPYAGYTSQVYAGDTNWLCRPGKADNPCDTNLDVTVVKADGSTTVKPFIKAVEPSIDCFYVYPTISGDPPPNSDLIAGDAERSVVQAQAARFGSQCRVFAPVYRQIPLTALTDALAGKTSASSATTTPTTPTGSSPSEIAYADVLDAWKQYMAHDNHGRGVVLLGHSQGSGHLNRLLKQEIDPNPALRSQLVAAYLLGSSVAVPAGADGGGDFADIPLCRASDQIGCVVSYMSFRKTAPPPADSFFGKPRSGDGVAACTNPAALPGGSAPADPIFKNDRAWLRDPAASAAITTPWVELPGLITLTCQQAADRTYLEVAITTDPASPRVDTIPGDLSPQWGLHVVDYSVAMGDLVNLVGSQAKAYAAGR
jgi:hypothetical protein